MSKVPEPKLDRNVTLEMMGDWGVANLHRICGWLAAEMGKRCQAGSSFGIWTGRGGPDEIAAVLNGIVDASLFVPAGFARTAFEGKGIFAHEKMGQLRAIATLPQDDRLVIAIDSKYGIRTLADLRSKRPALRVALAIDDGENMVGFATSRLLEAAGISRADILSWGGSLIEGEAPWDVIPLGTSGAADVVIFEAVMAHWWRDLLDKRDMTFIPIDEEVLQTLETRFGWARGTVPKDRFKGLNAAFDTLDFSDFILLCRDDLPDDIAYLMAWCICETSDTIEQQYRHIEPRNSPLTYPLDPNKMCRTSISLHPGAKRYYRDAGLL